jgi:uncharacterized membrane protein YgaE (UPF0421/DUF939 family)
VRRSLTRPREDAWRIAQAAAAAGVAWLLAATVLEHPQPVFAPTAAAVALAANVGRRGAQAVTMLVGVVVGVLVGVLLQLVLGVGAVEVALAAFVAMFTVTVLTDSPLALIWAGGSAVLVVALQNSETGGQHLLDAFVGGGVALLVSQVLFPPSPSAVLADGARPVLSAVAEGLSDCAQALARRDAEAAEAGLQRLRDAQLLLGGLAEAQRTAQRVARRTLRGRRAGDHLDELAARLIHADLLVSSAVSLARLVPPIGVGAQPIPPALHQAVAELTAAAAALARDPEGLECRRRACAQASAVVRAAPGAGPDGRQALDRVRSIASDLALVAGCLDQEPRDDGPGAARDPT